MPSSSWLPWERFVPNSQYNCKHWQGQHSARVSSHSLIQVLGEQRACHLPGALGCCGIVRRTVVAEKAVPGPLVDLDLGSLLEPLQGLVDPAHLVHRDHLVRLSKEAEDRALEPVRKVDGSGGRVRSDAAPVEGDGSFDRRGMPARR